VREHAAACGTIDGSDPEAEREMVRSICEIVHNTPNAGLGKTRVGVYRRGDDPTTGVFVVIARGLF